MTTTFKPSIGDLGNFLSANAFDVLAAEFDSLGCPGLPSDFREQEERAKSDQDGDADKLGLNWLHAFHLWAWPTLAQRFAEAHCDELNGAPVFSPAY